MNYLINYSNKSIDDLIKEVNITDGIPLKDLKIRDLTYYQGQPIRSGIGVYIFKSETRCYYVGNCVARCFAERIPSHFDLRKVGWFNSLLKHIINKELLENEITDEGLHRAAEFVFENLSLVLINFEYDENYECQKIKINNLERIMGDALKPHNTRFRKIKELPI